MRDALDASFSLPVPQLVAEQGYDMLVYTGNARPSRGWVDDCRARGVVVTFIQQTVHTTAQEGYGRAQADVAYAERRVHELGHEGSLCYVVSDGNRYDPGPGHPGIASYGQGIADHSSHDFFFYGNRYAVDAANDGASRSGGNMRNLGAASSGGWVPRTWLFDPARDLLAQEIGYYTAAGGTCDVNSVLRNYTGGDSDDMSAAAEKQIADLHAVVCTGIPEIGVRSMRKALDDVHAILIDGAETEFGHVDPLYQRIAQKIDETCGGVGGGGGIPPSAIQHACKLAIDEALGALTLSTP